MLLAVLRDLFPFLAALYVLDAVAWVRAGHLLFVCWTGRWCSVRPPGIRLAGLLPVDVVFAVLRQSLLLTPEGVYLPDPQALGAAVYDPEHWTLLPYGEMGRLTVEDDKLHLGAARSLRLPSRAHAESLAERLREIRDAPAAKRKERIAHSLDAAFDLDAVRARHAAFQEVALPVHVLGTALFTVLFVAIPVALYREAPPRVLAVQLYMAMALFGMTAAAMVWAGSYLRRRGELRRLPALSSVLLTPTAAPRAAAHLGRDLFHGFDAVAVAAALLPRSRFLEWMRGELHGTAWAAARGEAGWQAAWAARLELLRRTLKHLDATEAEAFAPPRRDPAAVAWCPYCDTEYGENLATCHDCALPLVELAESP